MSSFHSVTQHVRKAFNNTHTQSTHIIFRSMRFKNAREIFLPRNRDSRLALFQDKIPNRDIFLGFVTTANLNSLEKQTGQIVNVRGRLFLPTADHAKLDRISE